MDYAQQKFKIKLDKDYGPRERRAIAEEVIDFILDRTERGKNINNGKFKKYSPNYINSGDFKAAGKSPGRVDLELSGDMLAAIEVLRTSKNGEATIGYKDNEENSKAHGHMNGIKSKRGKIKRQFLGISQKDLTKILKDFPTKDAEALAKSVALAEEARRRSEEIRRKKESEEDNV